jgi:2-dehydro-3-deoxygalactonokinase
MDAAPALIAIDWGTSSFRAALLGADGTVLERRAAASGILQVQDRDFALVLRREAGPWLGRHPGLPVYLSGMIGSRQGWVEAAYGPCPAGPADVAAAVLRHEEDGLRVAFVPGLSCRDADGVPDVMRGEEVQVFAALGPGGSGLVVLPGTHSKWALVEGGRITAFRTFMTGELYAALKGHTILGRLVAGEAEDEAAFLRGVRRGAGTRALGHALFSARTLPLMGELPGSGVAAYLSGLLIGAEIAGGLELTGAAPGAIPVVGEARLQRLYRQAGETLGLRLEPSSGDEAFRGCLMLARLRGEVR